MIGTLISIALLIAYDRYAVRELQLALQLLPGILCGYWLGRRIEPHLKAIPLKPIITVISLAASLLIIGRGMLAVL